MQSSDETDLRLLRDEIQEITESMIKLAKARQDLSSKLAHVKAKLNLPIEDLEREKLLYEKVEIFSKKLGLETSLAQDLTRILMEESKRVQRKTIHYSSIRKALKRNSIETVSILGFGRMGEWFASYFYELVTNVLVFDRDRRRFRSKELPFKIATDLDETIDKSDLIVVAVPIKETANVLERIFEQGSKTGKLLIFEVSSIKSPIESRMERLSIPNGISIISIHPLFGGSANSFDSLVMIDTSGRKTEIVREIFPQFKIMKMDAQTHDQLMALVLSVPHLIALSFADVLYKNRSKLLSQINSPSFDALRGLSMKALSESPTVYHQIQSENKYFDEVSNELEETIKRVRRLLQNEKEFEAFYLKTRKNLQSR